MHTRGIVIEATVGIESIISDLLTRMLKIELKESKLLGFKSSALSFNAKSGLLQELNSTPKDISDALDIVMRIRNKFAHVQEVTSFTVYFEKYGTKEDKSKLLNFGKPYLPSNGTEEDFYILCFHTMCLRISSYATNSLISIIDDQKRESTYSEIIQDLNDFNSEEVGITPMDFILKIKERINNTFINGG